MYKNNSATLIISIFFKADIEDNVTTWDDSHYFRKWEQKIINHIHTEDGADLDNGFDNYNDDDNLCKVEMEDDKEQEWKPPVTCIKFAKKKLRVKKKLVHKQKTRKTPAPRKVLNCELCDYTTGLDVKLKVHQFEEHQKPLVCHDCNMSFNQPDLYMQHLKTHRTTCTICGKSVRNIQNHMYHNHEEGSTKTEVCALCGTSIKALGMSKHMKKVHGTKTYPCPHCQYVSKTSYDLKGHIKRKHTESNIVNCPWCGRITKDLPRHLKNNLCNIPEEEREKLNVKMYVCNICPKQFKKQSSLLSHFKVIHEQVKDFECQLCTYKTSNNYNLKLHVKRVHEKKPLKEKCPHCENSFLNLDYHIETYHGELLLQAQMMTGTTLDLPGGKNREKYKY